MDILTITPKEALLATACGIRKLAAKAISFSQSDTVNEAEIRSRIYTQMVEAPVQSEDELDGQLPLW
jgi:hypothetical protein